MARRAKTRHTSLVSVGDTPAIGPAPGKAMTTTVAVVVTWFYALLVMLSSLAFFALGVMFIGFQQTAHSLFGRLAADYRLGYVAAFILFMAGVFTLGMGVLLVFIAIGLGRRRRWARVCAIIAYGIFLLAGLGGLFPSRPPTAYGSNNPQPQPTPRSNPGAALLVVVVDGAVLYFLVGPQGRRDFAR